MAVIPPTLPTPPLLTSLKTLIPHQISPPPPSTLQPLLTFLRPDWLRNFLFTPSPIHRAALSNPQSPFTCLMNATRLDPSNQETHHLHNRYLFSPSFSVPPYTAGFGIMHCQMHIPVLDIWAHACTKTLPFRFVRDAERHISVEVMHVEEYDVTLIFFSQLQTTCQTSAVTVFCTRSTLLAILDRAFDVPEAKALFPAIQFVQHDVQKHLCKICTAPSCSSCSLPYDRPLHPFDADFFRRSMQLHLGVYESAANKLCINVPGTPGVRQVVMGSRVSLCGVPDGGFVKEVVEIVLRTEVGGSVGEVARSVPLLEAEWIWEEDGSGLVEGVMSGGSGSGGTGGSTGISESGGDVWVAEVQEEGAEGLAEVEANGTGISGETRGKAEASTEPGGVSNDTGQDGSREDSKEEEEERKKEERRRRLRARRERNREAARRSNLARKMFLEGLVRDLDEGRKGVQQLREREMTLREENLRLKRMLGRGVG